MVPICYEESLTNGCGPSCAEFMATATEQYIKEVVSSILARTRSNVPAAIGGNGIMTRKYRKQLDREEEGFLKGEVIRGIGNGLLPVEAKEAGGRRGIGMGDLRLAIGIGGCELGQMPGTVAGIMGGWEEGILEGWGRPKDDPAKDKDDLDNGGPRTNGLQHGVNGDVAEHDADDADWGWEGGALSDRPLLHSLLDDVLAVGS